MFIFFLTPEVYTPQIKCVHILNINQEYPYLCHFSKIVKFQLKALKIYGQTLFNGYPSVNVFYPIKYNRYFFVVNISFEYTNLIMPII